MSHTLKVIAGGVVLLVACLLIGRFIGGPTPAAGLATAAKVFIPLWLIAAGINMWVGVAKAGYTVADEERDEAVVLQVAGDVDCCHPADACFALDLVALGEGGGEPREGVGHRARK